MILLPSRSSSERLSLVRSEHTSTTLLASSETYQSPSQSYQRPASPTAPTPPSISGKTQAPPQQRTR
ncbi:hypothetical protein KIPB_016770 [Kipferlia bialata]|uniref:Uncharacterized protein n=1 Tax=Kipferlia bialata TaxID=797122 RepID=A0A391NVY6_9EUKA|nr:hypothetical protein KIPB_016770 [Kipferlia bialata]|eukprot:g16770.t1